MIHAGSTGTVIGLVPEAHLGIVVLTNGGLGLQIMVMHDIIDRMLGIPETWQTATSSSTRLMITRNRSTPRTGDSSRNEAVGRRGLRWPNSLGRMSRMLMGGWSSNKRATLCRCGWVPMAARNSFIGPGSVFAPLSCFASLRIGSCHLIPTAAEFRE